MPFLLPRSLADARELFFFADIRPKFVKKETGEHIRLLAMRTNLLS